MTTAARVFVGCSANHEDLESQAVLEYTLREHSSVPVDIVWMRLSRDPDSPFYSDHPNGWRTDNWATPFSGFRWAIPALCGNEGLAVYMDSDFIVRADIAELLSTPMQPGKVVVAKGESQSRRYCCSLWDCAGAGQAIARALLGAGMATAAPVHALTAMRSSPDTHRRLTDFFATHHNLVQSFAPDADWNVMDFPPYPPLDAPHIKAIHYTRMERQVHLKYAVPRLKAEGKVHWYDRDIVAHDWSELQTLFDGLLVSAQESGYTLDRYRLPEYGKYHIRGK